MKKYISWNVNGLRACERKGFSEAFRSLDADVFCLQEIKLVEGQLELATEGYFQYWNYADKKGYSGTAVFSKQEPLSVTKGIGNELDNEGRALTLEFPELFLVNEYVPNSREGLARLGPRIKWEEALRSYLLGLNEIKPVVLCGDLNVAHEEKDLRHPEANRGNAGFSDEERAEFGKLLDCGFTDSFRYKYPDRTEAYSWWSYRANARASNAGWRIDYFVLSDSLRDKISDALIHPEIFGSDHCPVELLLEL